MTKDRMEIFSDSVVAIIITIMVLDLHIPRVSTWDALKPLEPIFASYLLGFVNLGAWWLNHHRLLNYARKINGTVLVANLYLLFCLSLFPFVTGWMGENHFAPLPVAGFGVVSLMTSIAYAVLDVLTTGKESLRERRHIKGLATLGLYIAAIALAFVISWVSLAIYVFVALMWTVPPKERAR